MQAEEGRHIAPVPLPALGSVLGQTPVSTEEVAGSRKPPSSITAANTGCFHPRVGLTPPISATLVTCHLGIAENPCASVFPFSRPLQELGAAAYGCRPQKAAQEMLSICVTTWGECGDRTGWNWMKQRPTNPICLQNGQSSPSVFFFLPRF